MKTKKTKISYLEAFSQFPKESNVLLEELRDSLKDSFSLEKVKWELDIDSLYVKVGRKLFSTSINTFDSSFIDEMPTSMFEKDGLYQQIKWLLLDDALAKFGEPAAADQATERAQLLLQSLHNNIAKMLREYL